MQRLPVKLLEPGMKVARAVVNESGSVLVAAGSELSEKTIMRLENMEVSRVCVKGCPVQLADYMPVPLSEKLAAMETGFSPYGEGDKLMQRFRVLVKAHFIKREREMREDDEMTGITEE